MSEASGPGVDAEQALALAQRVGQAMSAQDPSYHFLGVSLEAIAPGYARMAMTVTEPMLNSLALCHGGFSYKLADDAFAYACNAYNRNAVGVACSVNYLAPAKLGDRLVAEAREVHRNGRKGIYDVTVTNQEGTVICLFRGECRVVEGQMLPDDQGPMATRK